MAFAMTRKNSFPRLGDRRLRLGIVLTLDQRRLLAVLPAVESAAGIGLDADLEAGSGRLARPAARAARSEAVVRAELVPAVASSLVSPRDARCQCCEHQQLTPMQLTGGRSRHFMCMATSHEPA